MKPNTVIITGGTSGIGKALINGFINDNWNVISTFHSNEEDANLLIKNIKGSSLSFYKLDLSNKDSVLNFIEDILSKHNRVDALVNNAAIAQEKNFFKILPQDWAEMLDANLLAPFLLCQKTIEHMLGHGYGRILNISSIGGQWGGKNQVHYAASKAGLINLTKSISNLFSKDGILANCISPGLVMTPMIEKEIKNPQSLQKIESIPIGRIATPDEIVDLALYLASSKNSYVTGQIINFNGGMLSS